MTSGNTREPQNAPVCFDATGTLFEARRPIGETYRAVALEFGVDLPAWRLEDAFARVLQHAPPLGTEGTNREARQNAELDWWRERIRQTFQATDSTVRFADFDAFAASLIEAYRGAEAWMLRPEIPETLRTLHKEGTPLAVASNFDHRLFDILQALEIASYFQVITIPSISGFAKPDREAFAPICRHFACAPEHLVYVGDDAPETLAALAGELHAVVDVRQAAPSPPEMRKGPAGGNAHAEPSLLKHIRAATRGAPAATL